MTRLAPAISPSDRAAERPADGPALAVWHAGWATACALTALGGKWLGLGVGGGVTTAVLVMAAPGLINLFLLHRDGETPRRVALGVWTAAAVIASILSGGLTGPLVGFLFMPFVGGLALGSYRLARIGAAGVALAIVVSFLTSLFTYAVLDYPALEAVTALLAIAAGALAVQVSGQAREDEAERGRDAVRRVEALLTAQPGLTLVLDPSGRILAAYGTALQALATTALYDHGLIAAVYAPDRPAVLSAIEKSLAGTDAQTVFRVQAAMDHRLELVMRRTEDGAGGYRLIAQLFDGTAHYVREIGLEAARAEAEAHDAGKTRFLANMSHELRTPLNAVLGFSEIMRRRLFGPLPPKYADYAESIYEAGRHLLDLINDVLDVSKIEAERYELSTERFDAREVVSAAVALMRPQADGKGLSIFSVLPPMPSIVEADRRALKQMTLNLLSNAVKFTPEDGTVTVTLETVGPYLELVVSDTGVGIAPEDIQRLGRPFEQAGGAEQRAKGTGLGLSLVRSLAELHGGRLSIESTLGEGAAVMVRMPVVVLDAVPAQASTQGGAEVLAFRPVR